MDYCVVIYDDNSVVVGHFPDSYRSKMALVTSVVDGDPHKTHFLDFDSTRCEMWGDPEGFSMNKPLNHPASGLLSVHWQTSVQLFGSVLIVPESIGDLWHGFSESYAEYFATAIRRALHEAYCRLNAHLN